MINLVMPMAGDGKRFKDAGYTVPKPLLKVLGKKMYQKALDGINIEKRIIFIIRDTEKELIANIQNSYPEEIIIIQNGYLNGAAKSVLLAKEYIDNHDELIIADCDQYTEWDIKNSLNSIIDGAVVTFSSRDIRYSYVEPYYDGYIYRVAEKDPITSNASTGVYVWKRGLDFIKYAEKMIDSGVTVNGEFYIAPVFNEAIRDGKKISMINSLSHIEFVTPESLESANGLL